MAADSDDCDSDESDGGGSCYGTNDTNGTDALHPTNPPAVVIHNNPNEDVRAQVQAFEREAEAYLQEARQATRSHKSNGMMGAQGELKATPI